MNSDTKESKSLLCKSRSCQAHKYTEDRGGIPDFYGNKYDICRKIMNCNTDFIIYKLIVDLV